MIFFKFEKKDTACFIPHLDTLRTIVRTIRRADIKMNFSQGFNPHMLLFFGNPISLGIESYAEYCAADVKEDISAELFKERFNNCSIENIKITKCCEIDKNPNIAGISHSALYSLTFEGLNGNVDKVKEFLSAPEVFITKTKKNRQAEYLNVKDLIYDYNFLQDKIYVNIASGNINLKPDLLLESIISYCGADSATADIVKLKQFVKYSNNIEDADEIFNIYASHSN